MKIAAAANKMTTDSDVKKKSLEQKPGVAFFVKNEPKKTKHSA